ncbi:GspH/FimT family pseudopilin [Marinobacter koreensis]|uniref:Type II secretion system protein H n=1 Tax=Marinobacter koreensis TaxID=335974 RepID=A0ABW0RLR0_9GAMM|nr:GspH/FimT family pseudopilin [Marinobacter koreensis]MCK7549850.1 GspH/FimT family pseudopilin [Marinobacter koreensis]
MTASKSKAGFTLLELLIVICIVALLAGFASPLWTELSESSSHRQVVNSTHRMFATARSYAVTHHTLITICPLSPKQTCTDQWNNLISIFPDQDNDKQPDDSRVLHVFDLSSQNTSVTSRTAGRGYFQIAPSGMSHGTMGSLIVCTTADKQSFLMTYLALNIGGRLRSIRDDDDNGVIRLPWGTKIHCPKT